MTITIDKNGYVNKKQFYNAAIEKFKTSCLNGFIPHDAAKYDIDGSPESWARFAMRVACVESGFKSTSTLSSDPGGSYGLFQWGYQYGINSHNWKDPDSQLDAFINYADHWVVKGGGYILPPKNVEAKRYAGWGGFGACFSTVRKDKVNSKYAIDIVKEIVKV